MLVSIFKDTFDKTSVTYVKVSSVLSTIKNGKYKDKIEAIRNETVKVKRGNLKKVLPCVTFSGTFELQEYVDTKTGEITMISRMDNHIKEYSQLIVLDIDKINLKKAQQIKDKCKEDEFVFAAFLSPSNGVKILFKVNSSKEHHKTAYVQLREYAELVFNVDVDKSGSNISRLCYLSYDEDTYYNPNSLMFNVDVTVKEEKQVEYSNVQGEICYDADYIYSLVSKWAEKAGFNYAKSGRNNYIHKVTCILNRAGISSHQIIQMITKNHSVPNTFFQELIKTVELACKRNQHEYGSKPIMDLRKKKINSLF